MKNIIKRLVHTVNDILHNLVKVIYSNSFQFVWYMIDELFF